MTDSCAKRELASFRIFIHVGILGVDVFRAITTNSESPRTEVLHNWNRQRGAGALTMETSDREYKLIVTPVDEPGVNGPGPAIPPKTAALITRGLAAAIRHQRPRQARPHHPRLAHPRRSPHAGVGEEGAGAMSAALAAEPTVTPK